MGSHMSTTSALPDAIIGSQLSRSSSTRDERIEVTAADNIEIPYCWTCRLVIETQRGKKYTANGFKLNVNPSVNNQVIFTAGHSVFIERAYAKRITVYFPGQSEQIASTQQLWAAPEYVNHSSAEHDYGLILLPGKSNEGFGWTTLLSNQELMGRPLNTCGYPSDYPNGSLWITAGGVENVHTYHLHFMQDSMGTGSGSPVYTWYKGFWTIVGIQSFGGVFNTVVRLTPDMMYEVFAAIGCSTRYVVQSQSYSNLFFDAKSHDVITCQTEGTPFDIIPLQSEPSTGQWSIVVQGLRFCAEGTTGGFQQNKHKNVIESTDLNTLYIIHHNSDGSVSFESTLSDCSYLCVDDSNSIKQMFVSKKSTPGPQERFLLHLQ